MNLRTLWRAAGAALLAGLLAACGPGVGGTGTGNGAAPPGVAGLDYFGAQTANACLTAFGPLIGCTTTTGDPAQPLPTSLAGECAAATFEGNDVVLDVVCLGWTFSGRWGLSADGKLRYFGLVGPDLLLPPTDPAALEVQVQGSSLVLWLHAADGRLLAGPLVVRRP